MSEKIIHGYNRFSIQTSVGGTFGSPECVFNVELEFARAKDEPEPEDLAMLRALFFAVEPFVGRPMADAPVASWDILEMSSDAANRRVIGIVKLLAAIPYPQTPQQYRIPVDA